MFQVLKKEKNARRGVLTTVHGTVQTPVFMNVGTSAAIKGGIAADDLEQLKCQIELSNTYHLHVRPGDDVIYEMGGLHRFMNWHKPILTDSGGFQVFSLASLNRIDDDGVTFQSHIDGKRIFMGPEESMRIQSNLASTIAMAFDQCIGNPASPEEAKIASERTVSWLERCKKEMKRLNSLASTINPNQLLFGINQGSIYPSLRVENMQRIAEMDLDGYAIGGLAVGESADVMYQIIETVEPYAPAEKVRYLMGVGTCENIIEAVWRGVDLFDCVMPSRNARHGHLCTHEGIINLNNNRYERDPNPIDPACDCPVCRRYSRSYIRHLLKAKEALGQRLCVMHNLYFYNTLMEDIRAALDEGRFEAFRAENSKKLGTRIK